MLIMNSLGEKIAIGSQFLLVLVGFLTISMGFGGLFYALFLEEYNFNILKLILAGALIFIVILLVWFGISYIIGAIYTKLKQYNFQRRKNK